MSRHIAPAERTELERRWGLIRNRLRDRQIDALVAVGEQDNLAGVIRWLTDSTIGYRKVVVFDANEPMTMYEHGGHRSVRDVRGVRPGIGEIVGMATFQSIEYCATYEAEAVCELARKRGYRRIALYHPKSAPHGFITTLRETLSKVEFVDESDFIDHCKAIKSPAEIAVIERGAAVQDEAFRRTLDYIEPGRRDADIAAHAFYQAKTLGGDFGLTLVASAPPGENAHYRGNDDQGRILEKGDYMSFLVEVGTPGGYFIEVGRPVSLGPPSSELVDLFEQAKVAQEFTISLLKPGAKPAEIYAAYTDHLRSIGQEPEMRLYSHGQGYDLIERPLIRWDETMTLEVGMNLAVHPALTSKSGVHATLCDQVIIEAGGARRLHKTARQIFQV